MTPIQRHAPVAPTLILTVAIAGCGGTVGGQAAVPSTVAAAIEAPATEPPTTTAAPPVTTRATASLAATTPVPPATSLAPPPPASILPYPDATALAAVLAAAEVALADSFTSPDDFTVWALLHQQAYRDLVVHPGWQDAARQGIPEAFRDAFDLNLEAGTLLRRLTTPQPGLPEWMIVAPPPLAQLREHYLVAETDTGVPWNVLAAIHLIETRFGRIQGDSHAGARGPMQFLPSTWEAYGEGDIDDPGDAVAAAARYLVDHGAPEDMAGALWAYNHSDLYVGAVLAHAEVMARHDHYLAIYHQWQVYYRTVDGDVLLEEGYGT